MENYLEAYKQKRHRLIASLAVSALVLLALLGYMVASAYKYAIHEAEIQTRDFAAVLEARLEATLRRADSDLESIQRRIPVEALDRKAVPRHAAAWDRELDDRLKNFPEISGFRIFDANGDLLYASDSANALRVNVSDLPHFRRLPGSGNDISFFSDVLIARTTGQRIFTMYRRLRDAQGNFRGMVSATIPLDYYLGLFRAVELGAGGSVAVYRSDDFRLVMRWPQIEKNFNKPLPGDSLTRKVLADGRSTATIRIQSAADGEVRIYSYHALKQHPFFISVGVSQKHALEAWKMRSLWAGTFSGVSLIVLIVLIMRWLRAEAAIARLNVELENRVRARTAEVEAFSYSISHDLRTPLRGISGIARLLETDYAARLDDPGRAMLVRMRESAIRMGNLIEDLLRLSRLTRAEIKPETVDLAELARTVAGRLQRDDPGRKVNFVIPDRLEVRCDRRLLTAVFENLLGNAWKFTGQRDEARIDVGTVAKDGKPVYFVRDDGTGFYPEHAGHLFVPFHRLHRDDEFPGTGIGLATVQRIIHRHGGRIWAEGAPGQGATFFFTLSD